MSVIRLTVNGRAHTVDVDPTTPLLYVLSDDLELRGPKFGCGLGQCGACTVIVKGEAVRSCSIPVQSVAGAEITTLEGLGSPENPHPIQQAFIEGQAMQCGFCISGVIMTAKALLDRTPNASDAQIRQAMSTVLCRCGAHLRMFAAIKRYQQQRLGGVPSARTVRAGVQRRTA
ncbi:MAG: (2Fe-2S)-binding protein [Acidobacteria bacterium]|nr:(2Fe-2S)-binding protein [Acidobacteriota bacterium]